MIIKKVGTAKKFQKTDKTNLPNAVNILIVGTNFLLRYYDNKRHF